MDDLHTLNRLVYECFNVEVALRLENLRHLRLGIRVLRGEYGAAVLVGKDGGLKGVDLTAIVTISSLSMPMQGRNTGRSHTAPVTAMAGMVWLAT